VQNLTVGSPTRLILSFSLPMLLGSLFHQAYAFADAIVVGRFLGVESLAAVGAASSATFLLMGFSCGAAPGITIPLARAQGEGDAAGVRRQLAAATLSALALAAAVSAVGLPLVQPLLRLMSTPAEILDQTAAVVTLVFATAVVAVLFNVTIAAVRSLGDSRTPFVAHIVSALLNAVFVVLLVGVAGRGVTGAVASTVVSQAVAGAWCVAVVLRRQPELRLRRADWVAGRRAMAAPLRTGLPMGVQTSIIALGGLALQTSVNGLGASAVAAFTAVQRVGMLAAAPLAALGAAMVTYVAQNRGARQWVRVRAGVLRTSVIAGAVAVVLGVALLVFSRHVVGLFVNQGDVVDLAASVFLVKGGMYPVLGVLMVLRSAVQGLGKTTAPTVSSAFQLAARLLAALVLIPVIGFTGVALTEPLAWVAGLVPITWAWLRERGRLGATRVAGADGRVESPTTSEAEAEAAAEVPVVEGDGGPGRPACVPDRPRPRLRPRRGLPRRRAPHARRLPA